MREIKFKAYHPEAGSREFTFSDIDGHGFITMNPGFVDLADCKVAQWTGLCDKHDTPIYEGDIVGWFRPEEGVQVEFRNGAFGIEYFKEWIVLGINAQHFAEVLGNIYENPELLADQTPSPTP